jgi:tryptophan 2,3-dioxygenase
MAAETRRTQQSGERLPTSIHGLLETPYAEYLNLDTVFDIQVAATETGQLHHPEEVLFRTVHLSSELWLRMAGYDIERVRDALTSSDLVQAIRLTRRVNLAVSRVTDATAVLVTTTSSASISAAPADFSHRAMPTCAVNVVAWRRCSTPW